MSRSRIATLLTLGLLFGCSFFTGPPADINDRIERAVVRGDTTKALKLLGSVVHDGDAPPDTYVRMGILYRESRSITGRRQSEEILTRGLREYPDDVEITLELGKTYYAQTFYGDAARMFERVVQLEPGHCEAQFWLAKDWYRKWKHVRVYREYLHKARSLARQVVECDPDNETALYLLAFSLFALGDSTEAVERIDDYIRAYPDQPRGYLLRGSVEFERMQYEECDSILHLGLGLMTEEERAAHESIELLLSDEEVEGYELLSLPQQEERNRIFWAQLDPDLTTELNERRVEHVYRMFLADQYFRHKRPPLRGWETERGRALVKFGWPQAVGTTLEGRFTSGRMVVWQYANPRNTFTLFFRDEFLNGNYIVPMEPRFSYSAQTLFNEEPSTTYLTPYALIPGTMDLLAFRNGPRSSEIQAAVVVDADSMGSFFTKTHPERLFARSALFGTAWEPLGSSSDTLDVEGLWNGPPGAAGPFYVVKRFERPFDHHRIAFCVEDDMAFTQSILLGEATTLPFLSDSLQSSDIVLHRGETEAGGAVIRRHGRAFLPNPTRIYEEGEKLRIYFEVYNLRMRGSGSDYEVEYSIYRADDDAGRWAKIGRGLKRMMGLQEPPAPVISQTIERSGSSHTALEDIAVDIDALRDGNYILRIAVEDRLSGEQTVVSRSFVKARTARAAAE